MSKEQEEARFIQEAKKEKRPPARLNPRTLTMRRATRPDTGEKGSYHYHAWTLTAEDTDGLTFHCGRCGDDQRIPKLTTATDTEP